MTSAEGKPGGPATVLIVDDHRPFRELARALLALEGFEVIGEAADGAEAIAQARRLAPDVVLLDIQLPDIDGFTVARELAASPTPPAVVLTSSRSAGDYGARARDTPSLGFVPKDDLSGEVLAQLMPHDQ